MKNKYKLLILISPVLAGLIMIWSYTSGPPAGYTGSPGDGGNTCTQCHSPSQNYNPVVSLTSNIPAQGYTPAQVYELTLSVSSNSSKHGFQMTAENNQNQKTGSFQSLDAYTQTLSNNQYIEHTSSGTTQTSWTFRWQAPSTSQGPVTFYAAVNATNANNLTSGDTPVTYQLTIQENTTNIQETSIPGISFYPNPVANHLFIKNNTDQTVQSIRILDTSGKMVMEKEKPSFPLNLSGLQSGTYILIIHTGQNQGIYGLLKK